MTQNTHGTLIQNYKEMIPIVAQPGIPTSFVLAAIAGDGISDTWLQRSVLKVKQIMPSAEKHGVMIQWNY